MPDSSPRSDRARFPAEPIPVLPKLRPRPGASLVVYYDEGCGPCTRSAQLLDTLNWLGLIRFREAAEHPSADGEQYVDIHATRGDGRVFRGFATYQQIAWRLPLGWPVAPLLYLWPITVIGRWLYRRVADSRQCLPRPPSNGEPVPPGPAGDEAALGYAVRTIPSPLPARPAQGGGGAESPSLTVVATNATGAPVTLLGLAVLIPVGVAASDLLSSGAGLTVIAPGGWIAAPLQFPSHAAKVVLHPKSGSAVVEAGGALTFELLHLKVNRAPGTAELRIFEGTGGCAYPSCPFVCVPVSKFPPGWGEVTFAAEPALVDYGDGPTLTWDGPAGAAYTIDYLGPDGEPVTLPKDGRTLGNAGQYPGATDPPLALTTDTVFTLNVSLAADDTTYRDELQRIVQVVPPEPSVGLTIEAAPVRPGQPLAFVLHWVLQHVDRFEVTADDGEGGQSRQLPVPQTATSYHVYPTQLCTTYTLTALPNQAAAPQPPERQGMPESDHGKLPAAQVTAVINQLVPVGTIVANGVLADGSKLPPGWLLCDGSKFSSEDYPDLYAALSKSDTVPDLRGYFLRGLDTAAKVDPEGKTRAPLSAQADEVRGHNHADGEYNLLRQLSSKHVTEKTVNKNWEAGDGVHADDRHWLEIKAYGGHETRPKNVAVSWIIFAGLLHAGASGE